MDPICGIDNNRSSGELSQLTDLRRLGTDWHHTAFFNLDEEGFKSCAGTSSLLPPFTNLHRKLSTRGNLGIDTYIFWANITEEINKKYSKE